jgi:hypothetical protein
LRARWGCATEVGGVRRTEAVKGLVRKYALYMDDYPAYISIPLESEPDDEIHVPTCRHAPAGPEPASLQPAASVATAAGPNTSRVRNSEKRPENAGRVCGPLALHEGRSGGHHRRGALRRRWPCMTDQEGFCGYFLRDVMEMIPSYGVVPRNVRV